RRVVERPMFHVALAALHHGAAHTGVPTFAIWGGIALREMEVRIRHGEFLPDAAEAHFAIRLLERERMRDGRFLAVEEPFVHTPEMRGTNIQAEIVHKPRDERQLFGGTNRTA